MKRCENFRERLGPWLDGELGRSQAEQVRLHIEACPSCREERRKLALVNMWLKLVLQPTAERVAFEPFWDDVRQRISEKRTWHREVREWVETKFTPPRLAWGVPAILAIVLVGVSITAWWPSGRSGVQRNNFAAVDSIDAYGRNVALLREDETKTTVIWLFQNQEGDNETPAENPGTKPSF